MILDSTLEFADAQSVAAAAGTAVIGNQIDLATVGNALGDDIYVVITVDTGIITGGSAGTVRFQLVSDDNAALSSPTVHLQTGDFVTGATAIQAGAALLVVELPLCLYKQVGGTDANTYERYLGIRCVTATTTTTAGKINAFLTREPAAWKALAAGI